MVLSFKRKFPFLKKIRREEDDESPNRNSIVCLKYIQHQEFDTSYLGTVTRSVPVKKEIEVEVPQEVGVRINSRSLESVTSEEYYEEDELAQLQKRETAPTEGDEPLQKPETSSENDRQPNKLEKCETLPEKEDELQKDETPPEKENELTKHEEMKPVSVESKTEDCESADQKRRVEFREEVENITIEPEIVKFSDVPLDEADSVDLELESKDDVEAKTEEDKPVRGILKKVNYEAEEADKKSALIFMLENHDDDDDVQEKEEEEEEETDDKPLKKFSQENVHNKTDADDDDDNEETVEKEYSSNAASIFFDDDDPEPIERVRKIDLQPQEDATSTGSQTSA